MKNETCKIYFTLHPQIEKIIQTNEKEQFLRCKFWAETKREAEIFYAYYPGSVYAELHRIVGILSGCLSKKDDLMRAYSQLSKLVDAYRFCEKKKIERRFKRLPLFKKILDGITLDNDYPCENLMDDVLDWCEQKQMIDSTLISQIREKINGTRRSPYGNNPIPSDKLYEIVKLLVEHNRSVFYSDAKMLLFPEKELMPQLSEAVGNGEILYRHSKPKDIYFFDICSLIKWLIRKKLLASEITELFPNLALEAIKENVIDYKESFDSIKKLVGRGLDRNDILVQAQKREVSIYLKYPREYLRWREGFYKIFAA